MFPLGDLHHTSQSPAMRIQVQSSSGNLGYASIRTGSASDEHAVGSKAYNPSLSPIPVGTIAAPTVVCQPSPELPALTANVHDIHTSLKYDQPWYWLPRWWLSLRPSSPCMSYLRGSAHTQTYKNCARTRSKAELVNYAKSYTGVQPSRVVCMSPTMTPRDRNRQTRGTTGVDGNGPPDQGDRGGAVTQKIAPKNLSK